MHKATPTMAEFEDEDQIVFLMTLCEMKLKTSDHIFKLQEDILVSRELLPKDFSDVATLNNAVSAIMSKVTEPLITSGLVESISVYDYDIDSMKKDFPSVSYKEFKEMEVTTDIEPIFILR